MSFIFRNIGAVFLVLIVLGAFCVQSASASDAVMAYRSASGSGTSFPKIKFWNSSASSGNGSWGSEIELPTSGATLHQFVIKSSPVSGKIVLVTENSNDNLTAYVCMSNCANVSNWQVTNNIADASEATGSGDERRFDVAFEKTTGNAIVVYAVNSNNGSRDLGYKVLPAATTNFSGITEQYINDTTQSANIAYTWIRLDAKPTAGSNEMVLAGFDYSNNTINAFVWNGASWGNEVTVSSSATATGGYDALAVRYAADGSKAMAIGANGTVGNVNGQYWNGVSWTAANIGVINGGTNNDVQWLTMKADPATDDLQATAVDSGSDLSAAYWNGSTWNITAGIETSLDSNTERPADFDWLPTGSIGRLVWERDAGVTTLSQRLCSPICNGSTSTISAYAGSGNWLALFRNPTSSDTVKILGLRLYTNGGNNPISPFWFGTNYTNYGDTNISADVGIGTRESYSLAFLNVSGGDTTPPNIVQNFPPQNYTTKVTTINFNFTATDDQSTTLNCSLFIDGSRNQTNASTVNNSATNFSVVMSSGRHTWSISCTDQANNTNSSATLNFTVDTVPPNISISSPAAGALQNTTGVMFNYTPIDDFSSNMSCYLYIDSGTYGPFNVTNNTSRVDTYYPGEGVHMWNVSCTDQANNTNVSATRNFTIDLTPPNINQTFPPNAYVTNVSKINFNFTATDNYSTTLNCSLFIDGFRNQTNASAANNAATNFSVSVAPGGHNWSVTCTDQANNTNSSAVLNLTVLDNCPVITSSYAMFNNFTGGPNYAPEVFTGVYACVMITGSNLVFDCNGYRIVNNLTSNVEGILLNGSASNVTVRNCPAIINYTNGVFAYNANKVAITNITAFSSLLYGIYLGGTTNSTISGFNASSNGDSGIYLASNSNNNNITNSIANYNLNYGIYLSGSSSCLLVNNTASSQPANHGIYVSGSNYTALINDTASSNAQSGFYLAGSSYCNLTNNTVSGNSNNGIAVDASSSNRFVNNTVSGNAQRGFYLVSSSNSNNFTGNNVSNSGYSAFELNSGSNNVFTQNRMYGGGGGSPSVYVSSGGSNNFSSDIAYNNGGPILVSGSGGNRFVNETMYNNIGGGIQLTSPNNSVINCTIANNSVVYSGTGFLAGILVNGYPNYLGGNTVYNSSVGVLIKASTNTTITSDHYYNNAPDLLLNNSGIALAALNLSGVVFDNDAGGFQNYTNMSVNDGVGAGEIYYLDWSGQPATPPGISFAQKFINITPLNGSVSLDSVVWSWQAGELNASYNESLFGIWKYSSGAWSNAGASLNTTTHTLGVSGLSPASVYGILQTPPACVVVNTSYTMSGNLIGAPNDASEVGGYVACIKIAGSNLVFDCNGYSITNNGTANAIGIVLNSSASNVTVKNCIVSNYTSGIYSFTSNTNKFTNNSAYNNTYGFWLTASSYNNLANNTAHNNSQSGFVLFSSASNNNLTNNTAYGNPNYGFVLSSASSNNTFTNNSASNAISGFYLYTNDSNFNAFINDTAFNNTQFGFYISSASYNTLTNNIAYGNPINGFDLESSSKNTLTNNTAYNNIQKDFSISSSSNNTLTGNTANNSQYGFYLFTSSNNTLTNNTANGNSNVDFALLTSSNNNTLTGNTANNGYNAGFWITTSSSFNVLNGNTAFNASGPGFYIQSSPNANTLSSNIAYNNTHGFYIDFGSTNNNFINNSAYGNTNYGVAISTTANNTSFWNTTLYHNGYDLYVSATASRTYSMANTTFLNPSGTPVNYTSLSISDLVNSNETYFINWSANTSALPVNTPSFAQKYVAITATSGTPSIDSIVWSWQAGEVNASYNESYFSVWKYNGAWANTGAALDMGAHMLTLAGLSPGSVYGILQSPPNCVAVGGSFTMQNNFTGAPNNASEFGSGYLACVKIYGSNLVFDCNGFSILNNGTDLHKIGIALNGTLTNVTIRNCPGINSYQYGVYAASVNNSVFRNNTLSDTSIDYFINNSFNSLLVNNSLSGSRTIQLYSGSMNNTVANNTMANCAEGIYAGSANNNFLLNNTMSNCLDGIVISAGSSYNNITGNRISGAGDAAIRITSGVAYNNVSGNTLSNNPGTGLDLDFGTDADNFRGNMIYNNSMGIYFFAQITAEQFWNTVLYNNGYDIYANSSAVTSSYYMYNTSFRDPTGTAYNVTLNLSDTMASGEIYTINWSTNSTALPTDRFSFAQKYLDITTRNGTVSIDSAVWGWQDSELSGYNESRFELWKYNASGWVKMNATRDTTANTLSIAGLNPASTFGILQAIPRLNVNLTQLPEGSWSNVQNVTFGYVAVSNSDTLMNCSAYRDGAFNMTLPLYTNGTAANFSIAGLPEGRHNWSVACNDSIITNASETRNFTVDLQAPSINLTAPASGIYQNTTSVMFNYTPTDNLAPNMTCRLYVDSNLTNTSTVSNNTLSSGTYTFGQGFHTWYVACTDLAGNTGSTSARNFTVDLTPPSVQLNSPPNLYLTNNASVLFNFTATDNLSPPMNCSVWVDGSLRASNASVTNNTAWTLNATVSEGQHSWYIQCKDQVNNSNVSATRSLTVDITPPSIAVSAPANKTRQNTTGVTFSYTPTDNFATAMSCSLYVDSGLQGTFSVPNNTLRSDIYYFGSGNHTWYVNCTDQAGNSNVSATRWFIIDLPPTVALNAPADGASIISPDPVNVTFSFTPMDDNSTTLNCTFYLDGLANYTNAALANGTLATANATLSLASHTWYVQCKDGANSTGVSSTNTVTVSATASIPSSGGGTELKRFTLSASSSCPGDMADVYAYTSGGPLVGATVRVVLADPYEGLVGQDSTDSSGYVHVVMPSAGTYEFTASKTGYANPSMVSFSFTPCAKPPGQNVTPPKPPSGANVTPPTNGTQPPPSNQTMGQAQQAISDAQSAISDAGAAGKDASGARSKLAEAQAAFDAGNYQQALELADQAKQLALGAAAPVAPVKPTPAVTPTPTPTTPAAANPCPITLIIIGAVVLIALAAGAYMMFGGKPRASRK